MRGPPRPLVRCVHVAGRELRCLSPGPGREELRGRGSALGDERLSARLCEERGPAAGLRITRARNDHRLRCRARRHRKRRHSVTAPSGSGTTGRLSVSPVGSHASPCSRGEAAGLCRTPCRDTGRDMPVTRSPQQAARPRLRVCRPPPRSLSGYGGKSRGRPCGPAGRERATSRPNRRESPASYGDPG